MVTSYSCAGFSAISRIHALLAFPVVEFLQGVPIMDGIHSAAQLVQSAFDGYYMERPLTDPVAGAAFDKRSKYHTVFFVSAWLLVVVRLFERPVWTYFKDDWDNNAIYPRSGIPLAPSGLCAVFSFILCAILSYSVYLELLYEKSNVRVTSLYCFTAILFIKFVEVLGEFISLLVSGTKMFSLSPCEAIAILLVQRSYAVKLQYIIRVIPGFTVLMIIFAMFIAWFTALAFMIFPLNSEERTAYYNTFGGGMWNMMVVLNGSNWPSPMIPAYQENRGSVVYFIFYLVIGNWGLINLITGVVFVLFRLQQLEANEDVSLARLHNISEAFSILDKNHTERISVETVDALLEKVYEARSLFRFSIPSRTERYEAIGLLVEDEDMVSLHTAVEVKKAVHSLSSSSQRHMGASSPVPSMTVTRDQFAHIWILVSRSLMRSVLYQRIGITRTTVPIKPEVPSLRDPETSILDKFYAVQRYVVAMTKYYFDNHIFDCTMDCAIFILGIFFLVAPTEYLFAWMFVVMLFEMVFKWVVKGIERFLRSYRTVTDSVITCLLVLVYMYSVGNSVTNTSKKDTSRLLAQLLVICRIVLFPRNIVFLINTLHKKRREYKQGLMHLLSDATDVSFLMVLFFFVLYSYSAAAQEAYGGVICKDCSNYDALLGTPYGQSGYWPLNFNDMPSGLVTMFTLLHVNNMHVTASGFEAVTARGSRILFITWYSFGVLLLLNIVTALFLNDFVAFLRRSKALNGSSDAETSLALNTEGDAAGGTPSTVRYSSSVAMPSASDDVVIFRESVFADAGLRTSLVHWMKEKTANLGGNIFKNKAREASSSVDSTGITDIPPSPVRTPSLSGDGAPPLLHRDLGHPTVATTFTPFDIREASDGSTDGNDEGGTGKGSSSSSSSRYRVSTTSYQERISTVSRDSRRSDLLTGESSNLSFFLFDRDSSLAEWAAGAVPLYLESFQAAAVMIQHAREGTIRELFTSTRSADCYRLHNKLRYSFKVCTWILLLMRMFERPKWTYSTDNWNNNALYPRSGIMFLSPAAIIGITLPLLMYAIFGLLLEVGHKDGFWFFNRRTWSAMMVARFVLICILLFEIIAPLVAYANGQNNATEYQNSWWMSSILIFWFDRAAFQKLILVVKMMPQFIAMLAMFAAIILVFAWWGTIVYDLDHNVDDDGGNYQYFGNFGNAVWSVFIAISSSSYPSQVMPGYHSERVSVLFYIAFIVVGAYIVMNVILVINLIQFQKGNQSQIDVHKAGRTVNLLRAFDIIDVEKRGYISSTQLQGLFTELYSNYSEFSEFGMPTMKERNVMIAVLDLKGQGVITADEFIHFLDITRLHIETTSINPKSLDGMLREYIRKNLQGSVGYTWLKKAVNSPHFNPFFDLVVGIFIIILMANVADSSMDVPISIVVLVLMIIEMVSKVFVNSWKTYIRSRSNKANGIIVVVLFCVLIAVAAASPYNYNHYHTLVLIARFTCMVRILLIPRSLAYVFPAVNFHAFVTTIEVIVRKVFSITVAFFTIGFAYACLGVTIFGGAICKTVEGNPELVCSTYDKVSATEYGQSSYYPLNFNDIPSALVTLFSCLHVSDFDTTADGIVAATNENAKIYFALWYCFGVLLMLSIVKSFFLVGFLETLSLMTKKEASSTNKERRSLMRLMSEEQSKTINNVDYGEDDGGALDKDKEIEEPVPSFWDPSGWGVSNVGLSAEEEFRGGSISTPKGKDSTVNRRRSQTQSISTAKKYTDSVVKNLGKSYTVSYDAILRCLNQQTPDDDDESSATVRANTKRNKSTSFGHNHEQFREVSASLTADLLGAGGGAATAGYSDMRYTINVEYVKVSEARKGKQETMAACVCMCVAFVYQYVNRRMDMCMCVCVSMLICLFLVFCC